MDSRSRLPNMTTNGKTKELLKSTPPKVLGSMPMDQAIAAPIAVEQTQAGRGTTDRPNPIDWPTPSSAPSHAPARIMDGNTTKTGAPASANNPPVAAGIANPMASPTVTDNIHRRQNPSFTSPPANVRVSTEPSCGRALRGRPRSRNPARAQHMMVSR